MEPAVVVPKEANKWDIRLKVWDYIETKDLATFPRPVHHRIPNFKGAQGACRKMVGFDFFTKISEVKVDPDKPLEGARLATLQAGKTLLVPTPRLRTGLFNRIVPPHGATKEDLRVCSTSRGVKEFSVPVGLDSRIHVDLVVVGSVAVSEKGYRIGKGEGFADMEYAMMVSMGAVNESTVVVTVVHDCQVVDIPEGLTESHDLTVDYILTPSRIIKTECRIPKPQGIIWSKLDTEMLEKIPILKKLRAFEQKAGKDVTLKVSSAESVKIKQGYKPKHEPNPNYASEPDPRQDGSLSASGSGEEPDVSRERPRAPVNTLYLGGLPAGLRVSELKGFLRERDVLPVRLIWQGAQRRAFLEYADERASDQALDILQGLCVNGHVLHIERAKHQKSFRRPGASKDLSTTNLVENLRLQHPLQPVTTGSQRRGDAGGKTRKMLQHCEISGEEVRHQT
ncbi:methenyltetrahydrofolate synthase domain-containing protein isoform X1 [Tachysurus fulvidraco]|uniref:methenyltetrahydrofolate synthase domain-containing protein isoform X1 n=1 Tax=Tachysurus fulvidraco TaxID=1234273 RepID=UPI000F50D898|nr:methenyltetrahydrofolate synthase domain-containing protein isoform X1 [Tachysurus fulvidraco]